MSDRFVGPKFSDLDVKRRAESCASKYFYLNKGRFEKIDILDILEFQLEYFAPGFQFAVVSDDDIISLAQEADSESEEPIIACTDQKTRTIYVSQQLYKDAHEGDGWARMCLAHELGHAVLHSDYSNRTPHIAFKYTPSVVSFNESKVRGIPIFRDSERQAEIFAIFLLAPDALVARSQSAKHLAQSAHLASHVAQARLNFYLAEHRDKSPSLRVATRDV